MNAAMDTRSSAGEGASEPACASTSKMPVGPSAARRMLVKNATLSSRFSPEQFDFESQLGVCAHQSLISDNRMTHLFNRDTGRVVCNVTVILEPYALVSRVAQAQATDGSGRLARKRPAIEIDASSERSGRAGA